MSQVLTASQPLHAHVLDEARRAGVAIDETHFAAALTEAASIGVAPLRLSIDELSDLRAGRNVMFVTLALPAGVTKTTEGTPIANGSYLLNVSLDQTGERAAARLMTTAGREVGVLSTEVKPDHPHEDRFAVSGHAGQCGVAGDMTFTIFGKTVNLSVVIAWC